MHACTLLVAMQERETAAAAYLRDGTLRGRPAPLLVKVEDDSLVEGSAALQLFAKQVSEHCVGEGGQGAPLLSQPAELCRGAHHTCSCKLWLVRRSDLRVEAWAHRHCSRLPPGGRSTADSTANSLLSNPEAVIGAINGAETRVP